MPALQDQHLQGAEKRFWLCVNTVGVFPVEICIDVKFFGHFVYIADIMGSWADILCESVLFLAR